MPQSPLKRAPLRHYPKPRFPVAPLLLPEPPAAAIARILRSKTVASAVLGSLLPLGACAWDGYPMATKGDPPGPGGYYRELTEAEARIAIVAALTEQGIETTPDVPVTLPGIEFVADGFSNQPPVGFEYISEEASDYSDLSEDEIAALDQLGASGGPYFLILRDSDYSYEYDYERETRLAEIRQRVLDFVQSLKNQGVI